MDLTTLLAAMVPLGIVIYWLVDTVKDLTNRNWNGVATRFVSFASAAVALAMYAHSSLDLGGNGHDVVSNLSQVDQVLAALLFAATAGTGADVLRTFNRADPNVKPTLLPGAADPVDPNLP